MHHSITILLLSASVGFGTTYSNLVAGDALVMGDVMVLHVGESGTYESDGTVANINSLIAAASPGETVTIPSGTHSWATAVTVSNGVILQGAGTNSTFITGAADPRIELVKSASGYSTVRDIQFSNTVQQIYITGSGEPACVRDCWFGDRTVEAAVVSPVNGWIVFNCDFHAYTDPPGNGEHGWGITIKDSSNNTNIWNAAFVSGDDDDGTTNSYIYNCRFHGCNSEAIDMDDDARIIIVGCTFDDSSITSHGAATSVNGVRYFEIRGNTFNFNSHSPNPFLMDYFIYVRGGTGLIVSNVIDDIVGAWTGDKSEIKLTIRSIYQSAQWPCQTNYPAIHQIGQDWQGSSFVTVPMAAIENGNGAIGLGGWSDDCGNGMDVADFLIGGRDYTNALWSGWSPYNAANHPAIQ